MTKCKLCNTPINFEGEDTCPSCQKRQKYYTAYGGIGSVNKIASDINKMPPTRARASWQRGRTPVTLAWNHALGAYDLKFGNTANFEKINGVLIWIKQTIPWNERDYNPETKIWGIHEKHADTLKKLLELIDDFDFVFIEKPEAESGYSTSFVPIDVYKNTFKEITGNEVNENDYTASKRNYRRACMLLHPDRNPGNAEAASKMSSLNEAWMNLEIKLFKTKEFAKQEA